VKRLQCATQDANTAYVVEVESAFVRALPGFAIVGLPSQSIQESKDRIKSALLGIGFSFPAQKITINLSPSDLKKEGSHFDLGVALLIALQKEPVGFGDFFVFGELGLDGQVKSTATLFSLLLSLASSVGSARVVVPIAIAKRASQIPGLEVYGVQSLEETVQFFRAPEVQEAALHVNTHPLFSSPLLIENEPYVLDQTYPLDFKDIKGQTRAKRAALISAAGMHNILFEGSPGCGKSMSAKRMRYILPPMSVQEVLETTAHRSLGGEDAEFEALRPHRSPHHTSSRPSIFGGGSAQAKIGEVALAHHGILFFDEFPHFSKQVLESLREPLEDAKVLISRVNTKVTYPTKFLFIAAQNPCPCGHRFSLVTPCKCNELEVARYKARLSGPLLDRIDLYVQMEEERGEATADSRTMHAQVVEAFKQQKARGQKELNGKLSDQMLESICKMDEQAKTVLEKAATRYGLSHRAINKTLKVSRTIADLEAKEEIGSTHVLEALSFRQR
jgi:magnesium chelatase family protein